MIRPFVDTDLDALYRIQILCPQAAQWRREDYLQLARDPGGVFLVAEVEDGDRPGLAGFTAFHHVADEAELRNIAIDPRHQRKGVARALLAAGIGTLQKLGTRRLFLEVRRSNLPALAFYETAGFQVIYTRRNYYHDPEEDALVMAKSVAPPQDVHLPPTD